MPKVAAKDRPALIEARRTQLLDATLRVLARKSFDSASVSEIAREAGLSKGTVYLYFENKDALLDALIERYSMLPTLQSLGQLPDVPVTDLIKRVVPLFYRGLRSRKDVLSLLLREGPTKLENGKLFLERIVLPSNRLVASWLERNLGPERAAEIDTFVAARALVGMLLVFFFTQELLGGSELHPIADERITSTVAEIFVHGVLGGADQGG